MPSAMARPANIAGGSGPLKDTWTFWFVRPNEKGEKSKWEDRLKELASFDSFDALHTICRKQNTYKPSSLLPKSDYHILRSGIRPEWEDPRNRNGGRWIYQHSKYKGPDAALSIDEVWANALHCVIRETLKLGESDGEEIQGLSINSRKGFDRISLWTASTVAEVAEGIGKGFGKVLGVEGEGRVKFMVNAESARKGWGSHGQRPRFVV